jgi:hypothetical protein
MGEHCGDAASVSFFDGLQLDYVTCSRYRIAVAKVAAAQAHIEDTASKLRVSCDLQHSIIMCMLCACVLCVVAARREMESGQRARAAPLFPMGPYMGPFTFSHSRRYF